jgi:molybdenum cofactor guanylyltransferase
MPDPDYPPMTLSAVILAGGRATRMGGQDKGLLVLAGKPMIQHAIEALQPQAGAILINANRHHERYACLGYPVVSDSLEGYCGPLAGILSAMQTAKTRYLLTAPCDSPFPPSDLAQRLYAAMLAQRAEISVAHDGERLEPVFALLDRNLAPSLLAYLQEGGRKIETWYRRHRLVIVDFSDKAEAFANINTPEELENAAARLRDLKPSNPSPTHLRHDL